MRPYDVKSLKEMLRMKSDNFGPIGKWSILHNGGDISLHAPTGGWVTIPRKQFNAIVDWYMAEQEPAHEGQ